MNASKGERKFAAKPDPFWAEVPAHMHRSGDFWIPGERVELNGKHFQRGPMYVSWEAPDQVTQPYPIVLVHGGALQGTDWMDTPDGRPGWAQRLAEAGYAVLVVDRPGHGRSPYNPDVLGNMSPQFSYEEGKEVFFSDKYAEQHTEWPIAGGDLALLDAFIAPFGPLPNDIAKWQTMDADRLAALLDRIGPAIIVTHSSSGSDGWLLAERKPGLVVAIVAIEPMGPPFADVPNIGALAWGLTAAPVTYDPPRPTPDAVRRADPHSLKIPALGGIPVAVVSGEVSPQAQYAPKMLEFLLNAGADAEHLHLPNFGIYGNGHGLIYENNSDEALQPVLKWLEAVTRGEDAPMVSPIKAKAQMVNFYVTYSGDSNVHFDRDYWINKHMPLVRKTWEPYGLVSAGGFFPFCDGGSLIAICPCVFRDEAAIHTALAAPETKRVMDDIRNFTSLQPARYIARPL